MGIPDTYVMPISDSQIFTATTEESSSKSTEEHIPPCTWVLYKAFLNYKKDKEQPGSSVLLNGDSSSFLLTYEDIKKAAEIKKFTPAEIRKATRNYSQENLICHYRNLYKGVLPSNRPIAVKWGCWNNTAESKDSFVNEINVLSRINHRNVVKLLGCCFDSLGVSIVYEYTTNGTLYDHLYDDRRRSVLSWNHRLLIGLEVAQVLAYLHTIPIIHNDVYSRNILLDDNYTVKLFYFGFSKIGPNQDEFRMFESDVYSFGVILAQLLTSKNAFDPIYVLKSKLKDDILVDIFDQQLVKEASMEQLNKVAQLAGRCLELKGGDRPTINQVISELQEIGGILLQAQQLWRNTQVNGCSRLVFAKCKRCGCNIKTLRLI